MNSIQAIPPADKFFYKAVEGLKHLFLALLAVLFLVELGLSLRWRIWGDGAVLHYIAYLINEHGLVPYRDIFDPNMPGTYLFHIAVGRLFGYSDFAFRMVDTAWLTVTLIVTWLMLKPLGRAVASAGCLLFGLIYLGIGPYMGLQRDAIAILPIATALYLATRCRRNQSLNFLCFLSGILFALAALIKPYLAIGLPALILYNCIHDANESKSVKALVKPCVVGAIFAVAGFLLTVGIPFLWLWQIGALESFWRIYSSYVPLYAQMSGDIKFRSTSARLLNGVYWYIHFGGYGPMLAASMFGAYLVVMKSPLAAIKKLALLLLSLSIFYSLSVAIGGKFWYYHWMPYVYFASLCTALLFYSPPSVAHLRRSAVLPITVYIIVTVVTLHHAYDTGRQLVSSPLMPTSRNAQVDEIATYLATHLSPTDKVQSLDLTGGALPAVFIARAVVATPYLFDFQFYHHVSNPYIQQLRKHFLAELTRERPTFIIDVYGMPKISGVDTTDEFPELRAFIEQHYQKDYAGSSFDIFRRIDE